MVACLYAVRVLTSESEIPPQDHVALAMIVCFLLSHAWLKMDQTVVHISMAANRCWIRQHRFCRSRLQTFSVSHFHSAKIKKAETMWASDTEKPRAELVFVTSFGVIQVKENLPRKRADSEDICIVINNFLAGRDRMLAA